MNSTPRKKNFCFSPTKVVGSVFMSYSFKHNNIDLLSFLVSLKIKQFYYYKINSSMHEHEYDYDVKNEIN